MLLGPYYQKSVCRLVKMIITTMNHDGFLQNLGMLQGYHNRGGGTGSFSIVLVCNAAQGFNNLSSILMGGNA